jgi:phosphatidylinositol-3-phosphatase
VPLIEASPAFGKDGLLVVLYDEDERMGGMAAKNGLGQGGHTICLVVSPLVQPGEYQDMTYSYSVLRTLQDGFGLPDYLGSAADVSPLPVKWK